MLFSGFSEGTVRFLSDLSRNNDRVWFDAHRDEYERLLVEPAAAFVETLGARLRRLDPKIQAVPRVRGSIKSIERRASFRKSALPPYKDHQDVWFWTGRRGTWDNSGFFMRLMPDRLILAAGMVEFQKERLPSYRAHVLDAERGAALAAIVRDLRADGYVVGGERYKRPPRGVPADHPRATLSKHGGLFATLNVEHPKELPTPAFVDFAFTHFSRMQPLHSWLAEMRG